MSPFIKYTEVTLSPMVSDVDGFTLWNGPEDGPIEFFDVDVRKHDGAGNIDILEEFDDLKEDEANRVFDLLCQKYPDADQTILY